MVFLSGCQEKVRISQTDDGLPGYIVGRWKAEQQHCEFVFDSSGVVAFENFLRQYVKTEEGGSYEAGPTDSFVMTELGPIDAVYDPNSRELKVTIVTEYFRMQILDGLIEGKSRDEFIGQITEDGKTWHATWTNRIAMLDINPNEEVVSTKKVTFEKIE